MSTLQEISGASIFHPQLPPPAKPNSELAWGGLNKPTLELPRYTPPFKKPPRSEGLLLDNRHEHLSVASEVSLAADLRSLRKHYIFPNDLTVEAFLSEHRSVPQILLDAVPHLKKFFGDGVIVSLESPVDDDGQQTLYAVVIWRDTVESAAAALEQFDETWWLNNSSQASSDISFTYELA